MNAVFTEMSATTMTRNHVFSVAAARRHRHDGTICTFIALSRSVEEANLASDRLGKRCSSASRSSSEPRIRSTDAR
eukprot:1108869-Prymnesium_polylepis.3